MRSFKSFIGEEKQEGRVLSEAVNATQFESVIVTAFNGGPGKDPSTLKDAGVSSKDYAAIESRAKKIASEIRKKTGAAGKMKKFAAGAQMSPWWKGKNTPKTDIYASGVKISLKKAGGSQLMSGRRDEALSTFRAAIEYMHEEVPAETDKLVHLVESSMKTFTTPKGININTFKALVKDFKKAGRVKLKAETLKKIEEYGAIDKAVREVTPALANFMEHNTEFRKWFVFEAATGQKKFSPDLLAAANWVVEFSEDGDAKAEQLSSGKNQPTKFINKLAGSVGFRMRWKTGSGSKLTSAGVATTEVALAVDVGEIEEATQTGFSLVLPEIIREPGVSTLQEIYVEELNTWLEEHSLYLSEGSFLSSIFDFFARLFEKIISKLREVSQKGIHYVLDFLGVELEDIEVGDLSFNLHGQG